MTRKLGGGSLVIATHNAGKLREIGALLDPYGVKCISAGSLGLAEPAETGKTFAENALIKARASAEASGLVALADDSGLSVDALDGGACDLLGRGFGRHRDRTRPRITSAGEPRAITRPASMIARSSASFSASSM